MNRPPITPKRILIAVTVMLLISSQLPARIAMAVSHVPSNFVRYLFYPAGILQRASITLRPPRTETSEFGAGGNLAEQLAHAKVYTDNLEQEIRELRSVIDSFAQIDAMLSLGGIRAVNANVIAFNGDLENPIMTIGTGSSAGVRDGLAVVWGADLIGKVVRTSAKTADVQLITAADTTLQVRITRPTVEASAAPLPAFIELAEDGRSFKTDEFALDAPVQVGDLALLADDSWQFRARGFIVGVVTEAGRHPDQPLLTKRVVIRPRRSLASLPHVAVLVPVD